LSIFFNNIIIPLKRCNGKIRLDKYLLFSSESLQVVVLKDFPIDSNNWNEPIFFYSKFKPSDYWREQPYKHISTNQKLYRTRLILN